MFKKGEISNPLGGKTKKALQDRLITDLLGPYAPRAAKEVGAQLDSDDPKDRQWAANMIIQYVFGKPRQAVEVAGEGGGPLQILVEIVKAVQTIEHAS
jgi:hypothetical protein